MDKRHVIALLAMLALAACSDRRLAPVPGADLITGKSGGTQLAGVTMELAPGILRTCEHRGGRMVTKVSWNAKSSGARSVTIWVSDGTGNGPEKSWLHGAAEGSAETRPWVGDGVVFRMADGDAKHRTLAVREVHAVDCMLSQQKDVPPDPASP